MVALLKAQACTISLQTYIKIFGIHKRKYVHETVLALWKSQHVWEYIIQAKKLVPVARLELWSRYCLKYKKFQFIFKEIGLWLESILCDNMSQIWCIILTYVREQCKRQTNRYNYHKYHNAPPLCVSDNSTVIMPHAVMLLTWFVIETFIFYTVIDIKSIVCFEICQYLNICMTFKCVYR